MDQQVQIYAVDTSHFYFPAERKIHRVLSAGYRIRAALKHRKRPGSRDAARMQTLNKRLARLKSALADAFKTHAGQKRSLLLQGTAENQIISVFDSVLTRTLGMATDQLSDSIIVVEAFYLEILRELIVNGFCFHGADYICFTASAGQIRTKKTLFMKREIYVKHEQSLKCGLTTERIHAQGGININKYLAYLALCNSATALWKVNISRMIVVDDMELPLTAEVDYIDEQTYTIARLRQEMRINHTDGCGMMLPKVSKKNFMVRLPWIKGLLVSFPFDEFVKKHGCSPKIVDIYGKEYDVLADKIEIILTKSQFKMWKYYQSWAEYSAFFLAYNCQAGICNIEDSAVRENRLTYQMLQTLNDLAEEEIQALCAKTNQKIESLYSDRNTMLNVFGVNKHRKDRNAFQKALALYPEMLEDRYTRHTLQQMKKKLVNEARAGKLYLDAKYAFVCPDLYAFCEYLFLKLEQPAGLLGNGYVSCKLFAGQTELDCLRSPHLYKEHAVRTNLIDAATSRWFTSMGIYTSIHDPISKILMFDNDGDQLLISDNPLLVQAAKRNMEGIVPLHYNMAKADNHEITNEMIFTGLKAAYTGGNIGIISNQITKLWNVKPIKLDVIKWLCMENNFTIDYAKTLYKPERPDYVKEEIQAYTPTKVPHFFRYAQAKEAGAVEPMTESTMNHISQAIINRRLNFKKLNASPFDYTMLMHNAAAERNALIIERYIALDSVKGGKRITSMDKDYTGDHVFEYRQIRQEMEARFPDLIYAVDVVVRYLYEEKDSKFKATLWSAFGDILYENLQRNMQARQLGNTVPCEQCGTRIEAKSNRSKYCPSCKDLRQRELWRTNKQKSRNKHKTVQL